MKKFIVMLLFAAAACSASSSPEVVLESHVGNVYSYGIALPMNDLLAACDWGCGSSHPSTLVWQAGQGVTISGFMDVEGAYLTGDLLFDMSWFNSNVDARTFQLSYTPDSVTFMTPLGFSWTDYRPDPILASINVISNALPNTDSYTVGDTLFDVWGNRTITTYSGVVDGAVDAAPVPEPASAALLAIPAISLLMTGIVRRRESGRPGLI